MPCKKLKDKYVAMQFLFGEFPIRTAWFASQDDLFRFMFKHRLGTAFPSFNF